MQEYKRICLPFGEVSVLANELGISRLTCSKYLKGCFDMYSTPDMIERAEYCRYKSQEHGGTLSESERKYYEEKYSK